MTSMLNRGARAVILAVAVLALACESGTEPGLTPIQTDAPASGLLGGGDLLGDDGLLGSELSFATRTIAQLTDELIRKKIDPDDGGELELLGHTLTIEEGAIDRPTMFVMSVLAGSEIQLELVAYDPDLYTDVGGKGFNIPVTLALSYAEAGDVDPESLTIVHVESDGDRVPLETHLDRDNKVVWAELTHFSRYALCTN